MSIDAIVAKGAFDSTTDPVRLAAAHAWFSALSETEVERDLFAALTGSRPCAAEVRGPTGSGKSSLIMQVAGQVARLQGPPAYELMIVRSGLAEQFLGDQAAFAGHLLATIKSQGFRFADTVQEALSAVGASETTVTDPVRTDTVRAEAGVPRTASAAYQRDLQRAYEQRQYGATAASAAQELEEVLTLLRDGGVRPVVIIDDTDRFADPAPGGLAADKVDGLFNNAIRLLADLRVDFVVAVHPRFEQAAAYTAVAHRELSARLEIPYLELPRRPVAAILAKHLQAEGIATPIDDLLARDAEAALWGMYAEAQDLRSVMDAAARAAGHAQDRGSARIETHDVSAAVRRPPG